MSKKISAAALFLFVFPILLFSAYTNGWTQTSASQTLTLKSGFNFVSFTLQSYLSPQKLMELNTKITDIYSYNAAAGSFISATDGALSSIVPGKGYIVKANMEAYLNTSGTAAGTVGDITLRSGFNLVGFSKSVASTTFSSLMSGYSIIKGMYKWNAASGAFMQVVRNSAGVVELLDGVDPAITAEQAYFINVTGDTTLNYDAGTVIVGGQAPVTPVVKSLGMITLSRPSIAAALSASIDLASAATVNAVYTDATSAAVSATWTIKSGGGSLAGTVYTAPSAAATVVLTATYTEGGTTKTADLTIAVQSESYTMGSEIGSALAWKWNDPGSDAVKLETSTRIDITAPNGNDLYNINFNAPRYTKTVSGDFVIFVRVFPNSFYADYNGAGIVIEDPNATTANLATSMLRFEYGYNGSSKFSSLLTPMGIIGSKYYIDVHDIYLKFERTGNKFTGYARDPNVSVWTKVAETTMSLPASVAAGIALINDHNTSNFSAYFTNFEIYGLTSAVSNSVSELTLSKTSDTAATGAAYDLSLITATAKYSNGTSKAVTPSWDVLIGSGSLASGKYTVQATSENDVLRASYTENGVSVSALFKLGISGGTQITYSVLTESTITQPAADTSVSVNTGGLSTDVACSVTIPANTLPAGAVVTIGKAESAVPAKAGIDQSKLTNLMPDVLVTAKSSQGGAVSFSGPVYFDIPASRLGTDSSRLLITCYNGKDVKYLAGRVTGDKFRIEIDPSLIKPQAAVSRSASAAPDREVIIVERFELASIVISIRNGIAGTVKALDDAFNTEDPGLIMGSLDASKHNVVVIHGIFSQTRLLGASDKPLKDFLTENGYNVLTFNYKYWESNFDNGVTLAQKIMALTNGDMPLTIVCHSMGGLVTRWALNYLAANGKSNLIEKVVFLSTPNRGGKMGSKNLSEWQEYLNSGFFDAARLYQKFGLTKLSDLTMGGFYFSSNLDNWPVGFLQLIGDKYDNSNFLASLNKYIAGRDYLNTSYYAMIDNHDEFVDVESIDFNSFYKTDKYPYSQCENFKNKSGFSLINKDYEYYTSDNAKHSATHNTALTETSKDILNFVKKIKSLSVTPASASLNSGGTLELSFFAASAVYHNNTSEQVSPQWEVKSGGGNISAGIYSAPSTSAKAVLIANYTDKDILKTAEVSIDITSGAQSLVIDIGGGVTMEFIKIKAGTFTMGSPDSDTMSSIYEKPQHQVTLTKDFYIGKYEVTQKQWIAIMGSNPSPSGYGIGDSYPVHKINSSDCFSFISKLNAKSLGYGTFKLPTEAQWEYACRAGTTTPYYLTAADPMSACGWYSGNSKTDSSTGTMTAHPVGQKTPNAFGLYDMLGNVGEFCSDMYVGASYTSDAATDPTGETGYGTYSSHVIRGGNFYVDSKYCRSASRSYSLDEATQAVGSVYGVYNVGLRVLLAQ